MPQAQRGQRQGVLLGLLQWAGYRYTCCVFGTPASGYSGARLEKESGSIMSLRSLFLLLLCAAIVTFVGVNWEAMNAPAHLNLLFDEVDAPLGLVLLGLMAVLAIAFISVLAYTQGAVLIETRRHTKEMAEQRDLADKAEASRFTELRSYLDQETTRLAEATKSTGVETLARIDRLEIGLREGVESGAQLLTALRELSGELQERISRLEGVQQQAATAASPSWSNAS